MVFQIVYSVICQRSTLTVHCTVLSRVALSCIAVWLIPEVMMFFTSVSSDSFFNSKMQTEGRDSEEENVSPRNQMCTTLLLSDKRCASVARRTLPR